MDAARFDNLLRTAYTHASRRRLLAGLIGELLVVTPGAFGRDDATAKKRKHKKKKHKRCTPSCDGKVCGDDGCGGVCGVARPVRDAPVRPALQQDDVAREQPLEGVGITVPRLAQ